MTAPARQLSELVARMAARQPDAVALSGLDRPPLTYRALATAVAETGAALNGLGIGRRDRVALMLPNGPELALAFLAVASHAQCAPLDPRYREAEADFLLADMDARALVVAAGQHPPARRAAAARGVRVLELHPHADQPAGTFGLVDPVGSAGPAGPTGPGEPDDVGLVLYTSGTTSRPKLVPLTHTNLCVAAENTCRAFAIGPGDRCLNVMPLFHAHGLTSTVLASIYGGASVVCTPGFDATEFFDWLARFQPTWYSAVPAMHQALLDVADRYPEVTAAARLRCIRSASAPLPGPVLTALEETFRAPVIEAYGMTEATSLVTSNPLPPGPRKPRSVGLPVGAPVAIMDDHGTLLGPHATGEVVLRGGNVMAGYGNNPAANAIAFTDGWFRTGDHGYLDNDGYLFLTGRTKEIINRGGSKVSPAEVDEALAGCPGIAAGAAVGLPHPSLGEDVVVAVVPRPATTVDERQVRGFLADRLVESKLPSRVFVVAEIPRTVTGKVQRVRLAQQLARQPDGRSGERPRQPTAAALARIWADVLGVGSVGMADNFFDLGGDSLRLARVAERIWLELDRTVSLPTLAMHPTVSALAAHLEGAAQPEGPVQPERAAAGAERLRQQRRRAPGRTDPEGTR